MRKLLTISLILNVALLCGVFLFWKELVVHADIKGGGGEEPTCTAVNGDVDGSGVVEVTDAIQVLGFLFLGEPQSLIPVCNDKLKACEARVQELEDQIENTIVRGPLPATGQTTCYDQLGNVIPSCDDASFPGQDGSYQAGCPMAGRFQLDDNGTPDDESDDTVTDTCTGLMWQQQTAPDEYNWQQALQYCDDLVLGGQDDWRLPNFYELHSLADFEREDPSADPVFHTLWGEGFGYWTSTSSQPGGTFAAYHAYWVEFSSGFTGAATKVTAASVRAVRGP